MDKGGDIMSAWIAVILSTAIAVVSAGVAVGLIKGTLNQLSDGQAKMHEAISEMTHVVSNLASASAVNSSQHDELSRRLSVVETRTVEQAEQIRTLRVRSHLAANKLQELDPSWKYYPEGK